MSKYKVGSLVFGTVTGIENYGVFVNLDDYYTGLIHISEISHGFVRDVNDFVSLGDTIKVKVIDVDDESFHVKLSIKDVNYKSLARKKVDIQEVGSGFGILEDNLPKWIDEAKGNIKANNTIKS
ncbi:MAG: S1 RNA-binding domain-containing protein [Bacilli bacterium]|nr:S1 RNA-binding domain-containing protein [Bacilli bacterium]